MNISKFSLATLLSCVVALGAAAQQQPNSLQCGDGPNVAAPANVVFMVDVTGSQSVVGIPSVLGAIRNFIAKASAPNVIVRPRLAIGSFNTPCGNEFEPCEVGELHEARPFASLSDNYTIINAVVGVNSPIGSVPNTGTNISAGLEVASAMMREAGHNPNFRDYVILITDGDPNFPGYYSAPIDPNTGFPDCTNARCPMAEEAARQKAAELRAAGIRIFTLPFTAVGYTGDGPEFLSEDIAYNSFFAYAAANPNSNLNGILGQMFDQIVCDDARECTADYCGPNGHCASTEFSCPPGPTPTPTATPTMTPTATPTFTPTPEPTVNVSGQCTSQSILSNQAVLYELTSGQGTQINRLSREVSIRIDRCPSPRRARDYTARARRALRGERTTNINVVNSLPPSVLLCPAGATNCSSSAVGFDVSAYISRSDRMRRLAIEGADFVRRCKGFRGKCEGSQAGCVARSQYRADLYRLELNNASRMHKSNITQANRIPTQSFQCR